MAEGNSQGFAQERFSAVRERFEGNLASGEDVGASFAATVEGETVVDLWGGFADEARTRPWEEHTIVNVYSTTKTMTALVALILADRGLIDFAAPVARYWPEFAANGKERITLAHVLSHSSGLSGWAEKMEPDDIYDWEKATSRLATQAPMWEPGTASGYHGLTQGYLVGEVVRRVTGQTLGTFFRKEIAEPLDADFWIGLPASEDSRVADLIPPPPMGPPPADAPTNELMMNMATNPGIDVSATRTRAWRAAEIPAANGHGNGRAIAQVMTILANGGVAKGRRFLSESGCRKALELQIEGTDLLFGMHIRFGMGFGLHGGMMPLPHPGCCFWGGYGGSLAIIDMEARAAFGYAMNRMIGTTTGDPRGIGLANAMWDAIG